MLNFREDKVNSLVRMHAFDNRSKVQEAPPMNVLREVRNPIL